MESHLKQQADRQELIQAAIIYAAGKSNNTAAHARRVLAQKYKIDVLECECEAEASVLAGEMVMKLAHLAKKVAA